MPIYHTGNRGWIANASAVKGELLIMGWGVFERAPKEGAKDGKKQEKDKIHNRIVKYAFVVRLKKGAPQRTCGSPTARKCVSAGCRPGWRTTKIDLIPPLWLCYFFIIATWSCSCAAITGPTTTSPTWCWSSRDRRGPTRVRHELLFSPHLEMRKRYRNEGN